MVYPPELDHLMVCTTEQLWLHSMVVVEVHSKASMARCPLSAVGKRIELVVDCDYYLPLSHLIWVYLSPRNYRKYSDLGAPIRPTTVLSNLHQWTGVIAPGLLEYWEIQKDSTILNSFVQIWNCRRHAHVGPRSV